MATLVQINRKLKARLARKERKKAKQAARAKLKNENESLRKRLRGY